MDEARLGDVRPVLVEPPVDQLEHRAGIERLVQREAVDPDRVAEGRQLRQIVAAEAVDPDQRLGGLAGQPDAALGERRLGQDALGDRLPGEEVGDEVGPADALVLTGGEDRRHRHADGARAAQEGGFARHPGAGALGRGDLQHALTSLPAGRFELDDPGATGRTGREGSGIDHREVGEHLAEGVDDRRGRFGRWWGHASGA